MVRRWVWGAMAVGMLASALSAKPGVVITRDGATFKGDVTETDKYVTIDLDGVKTRLDKRNVILPIQYTATIDDQFTDRKSKLAADDVQGRIALANWATQNHRADLAVQVLEEARKIDPMNREASELLTVAQQQVEMDKNGGKPATPVTPAVPAAPPAAVAPASQPAVTAGAKAQPAVRRLLNNDEINIIRQQEMLADDKVRVQFTGDVIKQYLASGDRDVQAFQAKSAIDKANEIIAAGDPKLSNMVRISTDPQPLVEFKQKIYPIVSSGCAASGCHGATHGGTFGLYPGDSISAIYTNFYILTTYAKTIAGTQYVVLDRNLPDRSLFLEYALPANLADVAHPAVANYRPRFRTKNDAPYMQVQDWLSTSLKPIAPDYHINVSVKLPSTQPAKK